MIRVKQRHAAKTFLINGGDLAPPEAIADCGNKIIEFQAETMVTALRKATVELHA